MTTYPRDPVLAGNGDVIFGSGTKLYRYSKTGALTWQVELGQAVAESAAIAADGTIYIGTAGGKVFAVAPNGTLKWTYTNATIGVVNTSITLGFGGRIFAGGSSGYVVGINPNGTQAWIRQVSGGVIGDMTMAHDGEVLYAATSNGRVHAIWTDGGTELWNGFITNPATPVSTMLVNRWGTVIAGTTDGTLMAFNARGAPLASRKLGNAIRSMAVDRRGILYVLAAYGQPGLETTRLHALYQNGQLSDAPGFAAWTNGPSTNYTIMVDGEDVVWGNFRNMEVVGIRPDGVESYAFNTDYLGAVTGLAMNNDGTLVFVSGPNVMSRGPGFGIRDGNRSYVVEPRIVPYAPGSNGSVVLECNSNPASHMRPGFNMSWDGSGNVTTLSLSGNDTGCPVSFCRDDETSFGNLLGAWNMLISTTPRNDWFPSASDPNGVPAMPVDYKDANCEAVSPAKGCQAVNPSGVRWNAPCGQNADCTASEVCAAVCPADGTGKPAASCDHSQIARYCADIDEGRCQSLPAMLQSGTTATCHEVRECASSRDRVNEAEATPSCFTPTDDPNQGPASGGGECNTTLTLTAPVGVSMTANFPANATWDRAEPACTLVQPESMGKRDTGGKGANSARNNKDWGLWMGADATLDFNVKPLPFGFLNPKAYAKTNFDVLAKIMGKQIVVFDLNGTADLDRCKAKATVTTKLFNQTISAAQMDLGYDESGTETHCTRFFANVDYMAGSAKAALMRANRIHALVTEAASNGYPAVVTQAMCTDLFGYNSPNCAAPYTAAKAANVVNTQLSRYRDYVAQLESGTAMAGATNALQAHLSTIANKVSSVGLGTGEFHFAKNLIDFGQPFNILGATAEFPIGPVLLTLEVNGGGEWGMNGGFEIGAGFMPPSPKAHAYAVANPFANVNVDVYLGVGFGIPGLKFNAGFGGVLTLVDIETPLRGGAVIAAQKVANQYPSRAYPAAFSRFQSSTPLRPSSQYQWNATGELNAAAVLTVLNGGLDARLRLKFLFFSKTWKRLIAEWKGKSWDYDWAGSFDLPLALPTGSVPVLDPIPFANIPDVPASLFNVTSSAWPTTATISNLTARDRADIVEKTPASCFPAIPN